ncbi:MAG: PepSY-associated TM helix domain-containing protein [Pseudomonadota bacterium]
MNADFRVSMAWLHTWAGVILGSIMMVMFFMGTLSVFKDEIDRWMMPQLRVEAVHEPVSPEAIYESVLAAVGENPKTVYFEMPHGSHGAARVFAAKSDGTRLDGFFDANTMEMTADRDSLGAGYFLYPMHYSLHLPFGIWVVGVTAMFMLLMMISGVVIHRKIFVDFFTFRPNKKLPRSSLDLHNATSVLAMPFHIMITLSGVIIFYSLYFAPTINAAYPEEGGGRGSVYQDITGVDFGSPKGELTEQPLASLDDMMATAVAAWDGERPRGVYINGPGDVDGRVIMYMALDNQVSSHDRRISFDPYTGEVLTQAGTTAGYETQQWISGAHMIFFDHWVLRWLYFIGGAAGCVMIGTGYIYWMETRRKQYATNKWPGVRIVEGFAVWGVIGLLTATVSFFVINRIFVPGEWSWAGIPKYFLEALVFYIVWLASMIHGWVRGKKAWVEQAWMLGGLSILAVALNWVTTGDHLGASLFKGDMAVASMDLVLLLTAGVSIAAARKIGAVRRDAEAKAAAKLSRAVPVPAE